MFLIKNAIYLRIGLIFSLKDTIQLIFVFSSESIMILVASARFPSPEWN